MIIYCVIIFIMVMYGCFLATVLFPGRMCKKLLEFLIRILQYIASTVLHCILLKIVSINLVSFLSFLTEKEGRPLQQLRGSDNQQF